MISSLEWERYLYCIIIENRRRKSIECRRAEHIFGGVRYVNESLSNVKEGMKCDGRQQCIGHIEHTTSEASKQTNRIFICMKCLKNGFECWMSREETKGLNFNVVSRRSVIIRSEEDWVSECLKMDKRPVVELALPSPVPGVRTATHRPTKHKPACSQQLPTLKLFAVSQSVANKRGTCW